MRVASAPQGRADDVPHGPSGQRYSGALHYEHVPVLDGRPPVTQIRDDGAADVAGNREHVAATRLARADVHGARPPVEVREMEPRHLRGTQPEAREAEHDRPGSPALA